MYCNEFGNGSEKPLSRLKNLLASLSSSTMHVVQFQFYLGFKMLGPLLEIASDSLKDLVPMCSS